MPLETVNFLNDLDASNPPGTDQKLQGDDHLRNIKTALRNTIKDGTIGRNIQHKVLAKTASYVVTADDDKKLISCDATAVGIAITLPSPSSVGDGFSVGVKKIDSSSNLVTIVGTVDGVSGYIVSVKDEAVILYCDGVGFFAAAKQSSGTNVSSKSSTYNIQAADRGKMLVATAALSFNLPIVNTVGNGWEITLKSMTGGSVVIVPNGSDLLEGISASRRLPANSEIKILGDGTQWYMLGPKWQVGDIRMAGLTTSNPGWVNCDGSALSRTTFQGLFNTIGTTYGAGDGSTTFNVPDYRGRSPLGDGQGAGLSNRGMGNMGGEETHVLSAAEMPVHSHSEAVFSRTDGIATGGGGLINVSTAPGSGLTTGTAGSGSAHNTMHPFTVSHFWIKY